ncbi:acetoacetate--CoA ligase [Pararhodobacter zhoushanensis]|uniref:Acetoacetate--CoA ligase n=1 Tax=Pararhodobacter zhoushanensis TaxID=2479545 RepID=A0ABT3H530_9RHOB|nr:acetoacetate--CoA ligase [Pararhodobacter zhoushanensis]MCW1934894.1 acetoacetate--CoA ligase [Pararhodobacter zhoushanensis]
MMVAEGDILWQATPDRREASMVAQFMRFVGKNGPDLTDFAALHRWSVNEPAAFWKAVSDFFEVEMEGQLDQVMTDDPMPRTRWFTGTRLNYAEQILRNETRGDPERVMLHHCSETRPLAAMSWAEVGAAVRKLATRLRAMGVQKGDRVVAYMPNIPETVIAMLASTAIGATWATAAPEFGPQTVIDRFSQIEPKLVFAVNGYRYGGKNFDRTGDLTRILAELPTATSLVMLDYLPDASSAPAFHGEALMWDTLFTGDDVPADAFTYERVASDHPLWTLFSSGTTGLPKPIVQGHHGIVLEHLKNGAFGFDMAPNDTYFCYSTTGWMVWNTLMTGPLLNGKVTLYDGHPTYPDAGALWQIMQDTGVSHFGVSPTFMQLVRQQGIVPGKDYDLSKLTTMFLTGSPATPEILAWVHEAVKQDLFATSQSGGTELCSGILAGCVLLPVRAGEIQAPALGCDACAFDEDGRQVIGEVGELVIRKPMPSMPLCFWGDVDFARYTDSYFDMYPGIWRHGDRVRFNDHGGSYVLGRSDATLNRFGVRIGSAEIYRTMEGIDGVADSLIICIEDGQGGYYMPLFVQMQPGVALDDAKKAEIVKRLRAERSPRHVPDEIVAAPEIPTTLTGKKMEVPVRKLLLGQPVDKVASRDATKNPAALDWFAAFAARRA